VVLELKTDGFRPEYVGQLGFYVASVDDQLRQPADQATVGILLCTDRNEQLVRYSLRMGRQESAGVARRR